MLLSRDETGFTLIELLIAMAIALVLMTGIYTTYRSQQKAYLVQDQVAAMQQQLRAAMQAIETDIRMAGYDPTGSSGAGITTAETYDSDPNGDGDTSDAGPAPTLAFTMDLDSDGANEPVTYTLGDAYASLSPPENDGLDDDLMRNGQPIAENIQILDFVYRDEDGNPTTTAEDIRTIEVTMVAKTNDPDEGAWTDSGYTNTNEYFNAAGTKVLSGQNDRLRRISMTKRIRGRNLGL